MFTGIIEATAKVLERGSSTRGSPLGLTIERPKSFTDLKIGSSICVSGVCLSVVKLTKASMQFDVVPETLKKSRLGKLKKGERVNLERAMKAGERLDGHVVQGHVEGTGRVKSVKRKEKSAEIIIHFPRPTAAGRALFTFHSIVPKGSIAIDGVSLTIAKVNSKEVTIALIPHTMKNTTLGSLKKGDRVNVETDMLGRYLLKNKK